MLNNNKLNIMCTKLLLCTQGEDVSLRGPAVLSFDFRVEYVIIYLLIFYIKILIYLYSLLPITFRSRKAIWNRFNGIIEIAL